MADERAPVRRHRRAGPRRRRRARRGRRDRARRRRRRRRRPRAPASSTSAGRTLMPGLIDAHAHVYPHVPQPAPGRRADCWPGTGAHFLAADLREALRMGITTIRDVGSYGDLVFEARQAMRYGAFRGPRLLDVRADHLRDRARRPLVRRHVPRGRRRRRRAPRRPRAAPPRRRLRQGDDDRRAHASSSRTPTPRR